VALAVGGALAQRRRLEATEGRFEANLERVNDDLAAAHAQDKGWDPDRLDTAARRGVGAARQRPGEPKLVAVVDRPGTEDDKAIFEVGSRRLTLGRHGDDWVYEESS
jgi:hypothetical protein